MLIGGVLFFPSVLLFCFRNPKSTENNQEKLVEGEEKVPRRLALVDRHLEKSENGNVKFKLKIWGCLRICFP